MDIIDYAQSPAQAVITKSQELKMTGQTSYFLKTEGDLGENKIAYVDPSIVRVHVIILPYSHTLVKVKCHKWNNLSSVLPLEGRV